MFMLTARGQKVSAFQIFVRLSGSFQYFFPLAFHKFPSNFKKDDLFGAFEKFIKNIWTF